jgi:hypothetical protein
MPGGMERQKPSSQGGPQLPETLNIKPEAVKPTFSPRIFGSSYIRVENVPWITSEGITHVISLEDIHHTTIDALKGQGIMHHPFPIYDSDESPRFRKKEADDLLSLVDGILKENPKNKVLIHCRDCAARTPEAIDILERGLRKRD